MPARTSKKKVQKNDKPPEPSWIIESDVTSLNMSFKDLKDEGANLLAEALAANSSVRTLNASWNDIGDRGAARLADVIKSNSVMRELDLTGNKIQNDGAVRLALALKTNVTLRVLKLVHNSIGAKGIDELMELYDRSESLQVLDLKSNDFKDDQQAEKLEQIAARKLQQSKANCEENEGCKSPPVSEVDDDEGSPPSAGPPQHRPISGSVIIPALQVYAAEQAAREDTGDECQQKLEADGMDAQLTVVDDPTTELCLQQAILCFAETHMESPRYIRSMRRLAKAERPQGPSKMATPIHGKEVDDWEAPPKSNASGLLCPGPCF